MSAGEFAYLMLVLGAVMAFIVTLGYVSMIAAPPKQASERRSRPDEAVADGLTTQPG